MKRAKKKGAIELSVSTIVIIVIGIVLLGLGITFVTKIFASAEGAIPDNIPVPEVYFDGFYVPQTVEVERGETTIVDIYVENKGDTQSNDVTLVLTPNEQTDVEAKIISPNPISLKPGEKRGYRISVFVPNGVSSAGSAPSFSVKIMNGNNEYASSAFIVSIN